MLMNFPETIMSLPMAMTLLSISLFRKQKMLALNSNLVGLFSRSEANIIVQTSGRMCKKIKMQKDEGKVELSILESTTNFSSKDGEPSDKMTRYDNEDNENEQLETEIFDTVLCTVPLGVLKVIIEILYFYCFE